MKIVHILFDDYPYISDWGYQENKLAYYQSSDNDVFILTAKYIPKVLEEFVEDDKLLDYEECNIKGHKKIKIYRFKCLLGQSVLAKKIKYYIGLYKKIDEINPDVIFIHDLHALSLFSVTKYVKKKKIICNADIHTNYANSCKGKLSKLLHRTFYKIIIQLNIRYINKVYYLNNNSKQFIKDLYGLTEDKCNLELLPLGGEIVSHKEINKIKIKYRKEKNISNKTIIFLHSGKFTKYKKTIELMKAFSSVNNSKFKLYLIGQPNDEIKKDFYNAIEKDDRIEYLGWKSNKELLDYLKICDIYLQPGSPSVTAHEAMCNKCAVLLSDQGKFYTSFVPKNCVYYIHNDNDLIDFFNKINCNSIDIDEIRNNGYSLARKVFDYEVQGKEIIK